MIEVALIAGLMMVILVATIPLLAGGIQTAMDAVSSALSAAGSGIN